ncbi:MAG: RnfABCDGE type electron transport complex subunit G [Clostridia bacterium]|nr:RnfABCDGE type electron transport complex subunit G [Clostridia bacterium]
MQKNENPVILAVIVFAITAVAALVLAAANNLTVEKIEANTIKEQNEARMEVMPDVKDFEKLDAEFDNASVTEIYAGKNPLGEVAGYCVGVNVNGFGGAIDMIVGVDTENTVTGVKIISMSETPGLGSKAQEPKFNDQFIKKNASKPLKVIKSGIIDDDEIVAISGATVTSNAVTSGVNAAVDAVNNLNQGGAANAD